MSAAAHAGTMLRRTTFLVAVLAGLSVTAVACSTEPGSAQVAITGAALRGPAQVGIGVDACVPPGRLKVDLDEGPTRVVVTVTALEYDPANSDSCAGGTQVELSDPLGQRDLVDGFSDSVVPVRPSDG